MLDNLGYGVNIIENRTVEISPHFDLWMMGDRWGTVVKIKDGIATVDMDHTGLAKFPVKDLKRVRSD